MKECCYTCQYYYTDYGMDFCKIHENPMDNVHEEKCDKYKAEVEYEEVKELP